MMLSIKHLRGGGDYITPNLCLNSETWETKCEPEEEISLFPEGFFPLYLTSDYCEIGKYGEYCYVNSTETTIKLYEILQELCEKYGEFEVGAYAIYLENFNIEIYVDNVLIESVEWYEGADVIYTCSIHWPLGGEIYKNGEVSHHKV